MSKEIELADKVPEIVAFIEATHNDLDGIDKIVLLKSAVAFYDSVVAAEATRTMLIKTWENIK